MSSSKMITLISSDGETFEVNEAVALESQTIKNVIEDTCTDDGIPLPKVTGQILAKVLEYCMKHVEQAISDDDLKDWDAEFVEVDQATLFGLIMAADYLNIKSLLELTCQTVADMFKGKTTEERRSARPLTSRMTIPQRKKKRLVRRTGGHLTDVIMGNNLKWVTI